MVRLGSLANALVNGPLHRGGTTNHGGGGGGGECVCVCVCVCVCWGGGGGVTEIRRESIERAVSTKVVFREPVWPSGKAVRLVNGRTSVRYLFGSPFSSKVVVCGHGLVTLSLTIMKH